MLFLRERHPMTRFEASFFSLLDTFSAWIERHARMACALALFVLLLAGLGVASQKAFWYDEIVTVFTAQLPTQQLLQFFHRGLDTTGPVQSLLARLGLLLPIAPELAARLPFLFAFLGMCLALFLFVRRRLGASPALSALLLPLAFPDLFYFMTEARAYAILLGGIALAMVFWQVAAEVKKPSWALVGFWMALAIAVSAHLFAVFALMPFAAAQFVQDRQRRAIHWPLWIALCTFPAGYLPWLHGALLARRIYLPHYHAQPSIHMLIAVYKSLYLSHALQILCLLVLLAGVLAWRTKKADCATPPQPSFHSAEWILLLSLCFLPVFQFAGSFLIGAYRTNYAIPLYLGLIPLAQGVAAHLARQRATVGPVLLLVSLGAVLAIQGKALPRGIHALLHPVAVHAEVARQILASPSAQLVAQSPLPVVLDPNTYMQLDYYEPLAMRARLHTLIDDAQFSHSGPLSISDQQNLQAFAQALPVSAEHFEDFRAQHPHFLLELSPDALEWLPGYLRKRAQAQRDLTLQSAGIANAPQILDVRFQ